LDDRGIDLANDFALAEVLKTLAEALAVQGNSECRQQASGDDREPTSVPLRPCVQVVHRPPPATTGSFSSRPLPSRSITMVTISPALRLRSARATERRLLISSPAI